jgi:hypothetical protein
MLLAKDFSSVVDHPRHSRVCESSRSELGFFDMKALVVVLAAVLVPATAGAATKHHRKQMSQAARGSYAAQIACTQYGCIPVPRGCYREAGRTWSDMPSGFDVVTCPGAGTMYGNR